VDTGGRPREAGPAARPEPAAVVLLPMPAPTTEDRTPAVAAVATPEALVPEPRRAERFRLVPGLLVGSALLLALAAVLVAVVSFSSTSPAVVRAESAGAPGPGPFTGNAGGGETGLPPAQPPAGGMSGGEPGLYGGTGADTCDVETMATYLETHPAQAKAWASAQGIRRNEIRPFLASLTPVILRTDTAVTNHDYRNGRAVPVQSILQAGTAVLIDEKGLPCVRCACGNPLKRPDGEPGTRYEAESLPWPGFSARAVAVIEPAREPVAEFALVIYDGDGDNRNDTVVSRPRGTRGENDHPAPPAVAEEAREIPTTSVSAPSSPSPTGGSVAPDTTPSGPSAPGPSASDEDSSGPSTSETPTSETPTSETPTSETPTSESPTSETPTPESSTTESSTSESPTSETPTSETTPESPTSVEPTTVEPTTAEPTTAEPTTATAT
jgi:hypothetical protein